LTARVQKAPENADRVIRFVASDESVDRDGDIVSVDGWELGNYMKNPVVLYGHDYWSLPVGKAVKVEADKRARQLIADVKFPTVAELASDPAMPSDHALMVDGIYHMARLGLLNTVSVGFRGLDYEPIDTGRRFKRQELLEISIVPVPANANAIAVMRSAGVDETIVKTMEKSGRRLSAATLEELDAAMENVRAALGRLETLMDSAREEPEEEENVCEEPEKHGILEIVDTVLEMREAPALDKPEEPEARALPGVS
jgi:phage head maturation protease